MPRTGTPASNSAGSTNGAPAAYTDEGPPDRMMAAGAFASRWATVAVCGTISEYTFASRTRRAISCAYWAPKSTTRTSGSLISRWYTAPRVGPQPVKRGAAVSAAGAGATGVTGATGALQGVAAMPSGLAPTVIVPTNVRDATSMTETVPGFAFELVTYAREPSDVTTMSEGPEPTVIGAPTTESVATSTTVTV